MPSCTEHPVCSGAPRAAATSAAPAAPVPPRSAIVLVLDANATNQRFYFGKRETKSAYLAQLRLLVRLLVSLRRARTTVPVVVLASGVRYKSAEILLGSALGVRIAEPPAHALEVGPPHWASPWARAAFAKLRVLSLHAE